MSAAQQIVCQRLHGHLRHRLHHHLQQYPWHSVMRSFTSVLSNRALFQQRSPAGVPHCPRECQTIVKNDILLSPSVPLPHPIIRLRFLSSLVYPHTSENPWASHDLSKQMFLSTFAACLSLLEIKAGQEETSNSMPPYSVFSIRIAIDLMALCAHKQIYILDVHESKTGRRWIDH